MQLSRMCRALCVSTTALAFAIAGPAAVMGQTGQSKPMAQSQADAKAKVTMASGLVAYGKANKDPHALLTAANILSGVGANVQDPSKGEGDAATFDVKALLDEAKGMAAGNDGLTKDIEAAAAKMPSKWVCYWAYACNYYYCEYVYYC